jgi:hypothetical protein
MPFYAKDMTDPTVQAGMKATAPPEVMQSQFDQWFESGGSKAMYSKAFTGEEEEKEEEEEEEEGRLRSPADLKCQLRWWPPQLRHVFAL